MTPILTPPLPSHCRKYAQKLEIITLLHPLIVKPRPFLITGILRIWWKGRVFYIQIRSSLIGPLLIPWLKNMLPTRKSFLRTSPRVWLKWAESSPSLEVKERSEKIAGKSIKKNVQMYLRLWVYVDALSYKFMLRIVCNLSSPWQVTMFINKHLVYAYK